ncbi:hypothetical protein VE02_08825 [Pseudogymnoascus sp. 03VT05]|nr:hypothetical protein VE02_08825 [Pseudogymnoascus sp. 03VT05]
MSQFFSSLERSARYPDSADIDDVWPLTANLNLNGNNSSGNGVYNGARIRGGRPALGQPFDGRPSQDPWLLNKSAVTNNAGLSVYKEHLPYPGQTPSAPPTSPADVPRMIITDRHLQSASGYALNRGNGRYTRLIAADELPPLQGPGVNQGADGLIILPTPLNPTPLGPLTFHAPNPFPLTPPNTAGKPTSLYGGPLPPVSTPSRPSRGPRKDKVYCDKWVHEGVCAFSQQGCRYKHEMPLDVATQHALGLFQGLPMWYKKENSLELRTPRADEKVNGEGAAGTGVRVGLPQPNALPSWRPGAEQSRGGGVAHRKPVANGFSAAATAAKLSAPLPSRRSEFGSIARPVAQRPATKNAVPGGTPGLESSIYAPAVLNPTAGPYAPDSQTQMQPHNPFGKQHPWVVGPSLRTQEVAAPAAISSGDREGTAAGSGDESGEAGGGESERGANPYELLSAFEERQ